MGLLPSSSEKSAPAQAQANQACDLKTPLRTPRTLCLDRCSSREAATPTFTARFATLAAVLLMNSLGGATPDGCVALSFAPGDSTPAKREAIHNSLILLLLRERPVRLRHASARVAATPRTRRGSSSTALRGAAHRGAPKTGQKHRRVGRGGRIVPRGVGVQRARRRGRAAAVRGRPRSPAHLALRTRALGGARARRAEIRFLSRRVGRDGFMVSSSGSDVVGRVVATLR